MEERKEGGRHPLRLKPRTETSEDDIKRAKKRANFARELARGAFRHFYWNDDLEREKLISLQETRKRIGPIKQQKKPGKAR